MSMRGYKVVNYDKWKSLPDIFSNLKEAREAKGKWAGLGARAVIEYFNSRSNRSRIIKDAS